MLLFLTGVLVWQYGKGGERRVPTLGKSFLRCLLTPPSPRLGWAGLSALGGNLNLETRAETNYYYFYYYYFTF